MAGDNVVIYYVGWHGTIFECNLLTGTYWGLPNMDRLNARRRALDWAGVPYKDWPHGEPDNMDEFGVEIVIGSDRRAVGIPGSVQSTLQAALTPILASIQNAALTAAVNPQGGRFGMVRDSSTGAIYAVAPGRFWHIPDGDTLRLNQKVGLFDNDVHDTDAAGIVKVRQAALGGGEGGDPIWERPYVEYTVVAGDTLTKIAAAHGTTQDAILALNPSITDPNTIAVGQVIKLPKA